MAPKMAQKKLPTIEETMVCIFSLSNSSRSIDVFNYLSKYCALCIFFSVTIDQGLVGQGGQANGRIRRKRCGTRVPKGGGSKVGSDPGSSTSTASSIFSAHHRWPTSSCTNSLNFFIPSRDGQYLAPCEDWRGAEHSFNPCSRSSLGWQHFLAGCLTRWNCCHPNPALQERAFED